MDVASRPLSRRRYAAAVEGLTAALECASPDEVKLWAKLAKSESPTSSVELAEIFCGDCPARARAMHLRQGTCRRPNSGWEEEMLARPK